ncbi:MAG: WYL domain-containing protein [Pseudomonas sp.]|nr:WYL domain-containing protein [Pseudomonas sp.]
MRITSWMADHLDETPLSDGQSVITDEANPDCFILEAKVLDSLQLRRWILSQGEGLVVLEPVQLRDWVRESMQSVLSEYR